MAYAQITDGQPTHHRVDRRLVPHATITRNPPLQAPTLTFPLLENLNLSASTNHLSHQILLPYPQSHALLLSANFAERMDRKSKCKRRRPYGLVGKGNLKRNHGYQPQNQCWATITVLRNLSKTTLIELLWKRKHRNHLPLQNNFDPLRAGENAPLTLPTSLCALTVSLLEDSLLELILATSNSYLSL